MALTADQLIGIQVGDVIESEGMFLGLPCAELAWLCQERTTHPVRLTEVVVFSVVYEDVELGTFRGEFLSDTTIDWKEV